MFGGIPESFQLKRALRARAPFFSRAPSFTLIRDESGQATVEYILLLAFVVSSAALISKTLLKTINEGVLLFGAQLERNIQSGRLDVVHWKK